MFYKSVSFWQSRISSSCTDRKVIKRKAVATPMQKKVHNGISFALPRCRVDIVKKVTTIAAIMSAAKTIK